MCPEKACLNINRNDHGNEFRRLFLRTLIGLDSDRQREDQTQVTGCGGLSDGNTHSIQSKIVQPAHTQTNWATLPACYLC